MEKELEKLKASFLSNDLDEEIRLDNEEKIREWERDIQKNKAFLSWQGHDVTRIIIGKAKEAYKEFALILMTNRNLTEEQRKSLWAKQDACSFLISLGEKDAKSALTKIYTEIKAAIDAT
jgi:L-2-hydroxyglutarate oxidase LhgO